MITKQPTIPAFPAAGKALASLPWLVLAAGLLWGGGCGEPAPTPLKPTRGYILISIDTLRADHLGCYGYARETSPFIDSLAKHGVLFENATVQLPGTLPSHMSIFTGLYPEEHGVMPPGGVLAPDIETLPELFQRHGFRTAGHSEGGYVHGGYGFARGFDEWSHESRKIESDAERTFGRGVDFLRRLGPDERFFLFLHTYSVHDPYFPLDRHSSYPQEKYNSLFWDAPIPESFAPTGPNLSAFNRGEKELSGQALEFFKARYDQAIRYVDDVLRDFFAELESLGLSEDVTVVLTSDHGEEFLEHGHLAHNQIYPECLHVPLLLLHPQASAGRRVPRLVESIDIAPTLAQIAGIETPKMSGESLVPFLLGAPPSDGTTSEAYAVSAVEPVRTILRFDEAGRHQLLLSQGSGSEDGWMGRSQTFDLLEGKASLEVQSFHTARTLQVSVNGEAAGDYSIGPTEWTPVSLQQPGFSRVVFEVDGCTSPASLGLSTDTRCLGAQVRGAPLVGFKLFDLARDPIAQTDRSQQSPELLKRLLSRLRSYALTPVSETKVQELDPELEQRLRALGYLR